MSGVVVIKQWDRITAEELNCGRAEAELSGRAAVVFP